MKSTPYVTHTKLIIIVDCDGTIRQNKNPFSKKKRTSVVNDLKKLSENNEINILVVSNNWLLSTGCLEKLFNSKKVLALPALSRAHKPNPQKTMAYLDKLGSLSKKTTSSSCMPIKDTPLIVVGNSCDNDLGLAKYLYDEGYTVVGSFLTPLKSEIPFREMPNQKHAEHNTAKARQEAKFTTGVSYNGAGLCAFVNGLNLHLS